MFNQTENMIARMEYQQMQNTSGGFVEGMEVAGEPGLVRRLLSQLINRKPAKPRKAPAHPTHVRRALQTKHG